MIAIPRLAAASANPGPLGGEEILVEPVGVDFRLELLQERGLGRGAEGPQGLGPFGPRPVLVVVLQGLEGRVGLEPARLLRLEAGEGPDLPGRLAGLPEPVVGPPEDRPLEPVEGPVVDLVPAQLAERGQLCRGRQALSGQVLQVDQVRVAGEGREALVRRVAVSGRARAGRAASTGIPAAFRKSRNRTSLPSKVPIPWAPGRLVGCRRTPAPLREPLKKRIGHGGGSEA